jgi:hypothetical protein
MYYNEHEPPHFHVRYGDQKAVIEIWSLSLLWGELSPRVFGLVMEWASAHRWDLLDNWNRARGKVALMPIEPLE